MTALNAAIIPSFTSTAGRVPTDAVMTAAGQDALKVGELAVNLEDQRLYSKKSDGSIILLGDGGNLARVGAPSANGAQDGALYVQQPAAGGIEAFRFWLWDETGSSWSEYGARTTLRHATDVQDVDPGQRNLLAYDLASNEWQPVAAMQAARFRLFTSVSGTVQIDTAKHFTSLLFSGINPEAVFLAGAEGVALEILNRSTGSLTLTAGTGVTLGTPSGLSFVRPGGSIEAVYTSGEWSITGDVYDPGVAIVFDLEDAQDYAAAGSKADGDLLTWDAVASKFTTAPLDFAAIETFLQANLQLGELSNVSITNSTDGNFLTYDATAGNWQSTSLDTAAIAADVQLQTNLEDLANVSISNLQNEHQLIYDSVQGLWVNIPGGDLDLKADKLAALKQVASNYTVLAVDNNAVLQVNSAATITLPSSLDIGFQVVISQTGIGDVTLSASTLYTSGGRDTLRDQYSVATAIHAGGGVWFAFGDLKVVGEVEIPDEIGDLSNVSSTAPATGQALTWNGALWAPATIDPGTDISTASIDELADVDTTTAAPTTGQGLIWNGSAWAPGAAGGSDLSTASLGDLGDVETTQNPPQQDQALIYNGQEWAPGDVVQYMDAHSITELFDVNAPNAYGQTSDAYGRRLFLYDVSANEFGTNGNICRIQAQTSFDFYSGDPNNRRSTSRIRNSVHTNNGLKYVELIVDGDAMTTNNWVKMVWPLTQPEYSGIMFADWDAVNYVHRLDMRPIYLADVAELKVGPYTTGDSIFWDGVKWSVGDVFAPGTAVSSTDLGASSAYLLGTAGLYADQAAMEAAGWNYVAGAENADDGSTGFDPGPAWTGLDFLGLGVSSQNWKVADVGVHFDADPNHDLNNFDQPMTAWGFDLLVQAFTSDSISYRAGWQIYNDGSQDWLVVRIDHQIPYGDDPDGIPVEYWFSQDGRVRLIYGIPSDSGGAAHTFAVGPTSNGVVSNGVVVVNPDGLTISGDRAFEFTSVSTPGVLIGRLADVDTTTTPPVAGDALVYNGTTWAPAAAGGGVNRIQDQTDFQLNTASAVAFDVYSTDNTPTAGQWHINSQFFYLPKVDSSSADQSTNLRALAGQTLTITDASNNVWTMTNVSIVADELDDANARILLDSAEVPTIDAGIDRTGGIIVDSSAFTGADIPLADGDFLKYDATAGTWQPVAAVDKATLQAEVAASTDFADFQSRIAAL